MIGVKPLFSGRSLSDGDTASFDVVVVDARWQAVAAQRGLHYELLRIEHALSVVQARRPLELRAGQDDERASPTARSMPPPTSRRASRCR